MLNFEMYYLLYCYEGAFSHDRKVPLSGPPNPGGASAAAITSVSACCSSWHPETASFEVRLLWDGLEFVVKHDCRPFLALSKMQVAGKGLLSKRINMIITSRESQGPVTHLKCFSLKGLTEIIHQPMWSKQYVPSAPFDPSESVFWAGFYGLNTSWKGIWSTRVWSWSSGDTPLGVDAAASAASSAWSWSVIHSSGWVNDVDDNHIAISIHTVDGWNPAVSHQLRER